MSDSKSWYETRIGQSAISTILAAAIIGGAGLLMGIPQSLTQIRNKTKKAQARAREAEAEAERLRGTVQTMRKHRQDFRERVLQELARIQANQRQLRQELQAPNGQ